MEHHNFRLVSDSIFSHRKSYSGFIDHDEGHKPDIEYNIDVDCENDDGKA